jgi:hypothetical protein
MQVQQRPESLLLQASTILCKSHGVLDYSKQLLRAGVEVPAVSVVLNIAEWSLRVCSAQLAEAAQMIDADERVVLQAQGKQQGAALADGNEQHHPQAGADAGLLGGGVFVPLREPLVAEGPDEDDEDLEDTCTSAASTALAFE